MWVAPNVLKAYSSAPKYSATNSISVLRRFFKAHNLQAGKKGASNRGYALNFEGIPMFLRVSKEESALLPLLEELQLTLYAAYVGVGPQVYMAGVDTKPPSRDGIAYYVLEAGVSLWDSPQWDSREIGRALGVASNNRLLLLDIKPENMLVMRDGTVRCIDFDTRFSHHVTGVSKYCLMAVNCLLLLGHVVCYFPTQVETRKFLTALLKQALPKAQFCTLFERFASYEEAPKLTQGILKMAQHYFRQKNCKKYAPFHARPLTTPINVQLSEWLQIDGF